MNMYLRSILLLLLLLANCASGMKENAALCFLTYQLKLETVEFAEQMADELLKHHFDIFIMVDDNSFKINKGNIPKNLHLLQIPNELTIEHHYEKAMYVDHAPLTAWDKALFYFNVLHLNYSFVWLCEDDVFIPSVQAFLSIHELYSPTTDLIVPGMEWNLLGDPSFWNWHAAFGLFVPPWAHSMVNLVGFSRRMLTAIDDYVHWQDRVAFHEFVFHIIAIQLNYTVVTPTEFSSIEFRTYFSYERLMQEPNNIYHPVKELQRQFQWRNSLIKENVINNTSVNLTDIETLCFTNRTMDEIITHLQDLIKNFKVCKSKFSAGDRHSLRQRFDQLRKACQKRNMSTEIITLTMHLADHAMKSPEPIVTNLITNKSSLHIYLERELQENKRIICQLSRNGSAVPELRGYTGVLIKNLTLEIQREYKEQQELERERNLSSNASIISVAEIHKIVANESVININFKINYLRNHYYTGNSDKLMLITIGTIFLMIVIRRARKNANTTEESIEV